MTGCTFGRGSRRTLPETANIPSRNSTATSFPGFKPLSAFHIDHPIMARRRMFMIRVSAGDRVTACASNMVAPSHTWED